MDVFDEEIISLWSNLNHHKVEYIMVGGFATNLHGFSRTTADIDLWLKDTVQNRRNFRSALVSMGLPDYAALETVQMVPGWSSLRLDSGFELDVMTSLAGFPSGSFDQCFEMASVATIQEIPIPFLHINHLIQAKKQSARPKDLLDVIELEKIRAQSKT